MTERRAAVTNEPEALRHDGRDIALVSEGDGVLITRPAPGVSIEEPDDRSLYYRLVLGHALSRAVAGGWLLDVHDADPDRLLDFLTARDWQPLDDGRAGRVAPLAVEGAETTLEGTIRLLGADRLLKPRFYQAVLDGPGGKSCMTVAERGSWVGSMTLRVAPLRTVLLIGLDEQNVELAGGLRRLGLQVLLAQQAGARRREVFLDLHDQGFPVFEVEDAEGLSVSLGDHGGPDVVVRGLSSDTALTPEGELQKESPLDVADASLASSVSPDEPVAFEQIPADLLRLAGPSLLPLPEAAALEFLLPVLEGDEFEEEGVEAVFDLTMPTTVPYGAQ